MDAGNSTLVIGILNKEKVIGNTESLSKKKQKKIGMWQTSWVFRIGDIFHQDPGNVIRKRRQEVIFWLIQTYPICENACWIQFTY